MMTLDWTTRKPVVPLDLEASFIELPAFTLPAPPWLGGSELVVQYNFSASKNFVIPDLPDKPFEANYVLAIRYRVDQTVYRYKLWEDDAAQFQGTLYDGEIIKKNFVLEVWSIQGEAIVSQSDPIEIPLSIRRIITSFGRVPTGYEDSVGALLVPASVVSPDYPPGFYSDTTAVDPASNNLANPAYFGQNILNIPLNYPAGLYNISYVNGAWQDVAHGWMIFDISLESHLAYLNFLNIAYGGKSDIWMPGDNPPQYDSSTGTSFMPFRNSQAEVEALFAGVSMTLHHPGGTIGLYFDHAPPPYAFTAGNPNPVFKIAPAFALPMAFGTGGQWLDNAGPRTPTFIAQPAPPPSAVSPVVPPVVDPDALIIPEGEQLYGPDGQPISIPPA